MASLMASGYAGQVEVRGPHALHLALYNGTPDLPHTLSNPKWRMALDGDVANGIGTGLYCLTSLRKDRHFTGSRATHHYKDGQAGWPDTIEVITIPDAKVQAEALRDKHVDIASLPDIEDLNATEGLHFHPNPDVALIATRMGIPQTISARGPLDDGRIAERWWLT